MMRRREFIAGLGAAAWPLAVRAQKAQIPMVGYIHPATPEATPRLVAAFRQGLRDT
jgi:hypothetical protein